MIKRILKKTPIIIIGTVLLSIPINKIYAYTFNVDFADIGKNTNSSSSSSGNHGNNSNNTDNWKTGSSSTSTSGSNPKIDKKWTCKYKYTVKSGNKVTVDGYNINNEKIIADSLKISDKNKIVAGTSIGLEIYEVNKNEDKEIILTSSTEGSSKKFALTVDDSGTISVTEVIN